MNRLVPPPRDFRRTGKNRPTISTIPFVRDTVEGGFAHAGDRYENDNDFTTAKHIVPVPIADSPDIQIHTFHIPLDVDFIKFKVKAGLTYTITTFNLLGGVDTDIYLYDKNLNLIASNDDYPGLGVASQIVYTATANQLMYVKIIELNGLGGPGCGYSIKVVSTEYLSVGLECILSWANWSGNLVDHSSYGNDGTAYGSPVYGANGVILDGVDDYLDAGSPSEITELTTYELEMWLKTDPETFGLWRELLGFHVDLTGNGTFPIELGALQLCIGTDGDTYVDSGAGWSPVENVWFHMVWAVPSFLNANLLNSELLFNNQPCSFSLSGAAIGDHLPFSYLLFGAFESGSADKFKGAFGEIRLYNRVRTASERTASFNATKARFIP